MKGNDIMKKAAVLIAALMLLSGCGTKEDKSSIVDSSPSPEVQTEAPIVQLDNDSAGALQDGERLYSNGDIFILVDIDENISAPGEKAGELMVNGDKNDSYDISLNENGGYVFGQSAVPIEMNGDKIVIDSGNLSGEYVMVETSSN